MATENQPWDRQPGEPPKAWAAFARYRDLGIDKRSLRVVATILASEQEHAQLTGDNGSSLPPVMRTVDMDANADGVYERARTGHQNQAAGRVKKWSSQWNWVARAAEWDAFCDKSIKKRTLVQVQELRKREQDYLRSLHVVQAMVPAVLLRKLNTPEGRAWLEGIPMDDLLGLCIELSGRAKRFQDAERLAYGVQVTPDEDSVGEFVWELKLKQPAPKPVEELESGGGPGEDDPYDVPPAPDPV